MIVNFDIERFVREKVTRRERSLLADDLARFDGELHERLDGKRALVIGGAGSIGSHFIKAMLRFDLAKLVVVDTNENGLTELVRDLRSAGVYKIPKEFVTYPVSFGDRVFERLFAAHQPFDVVANFAAHKHVRSEKDVFSIEAMLENNVLRARGLLELVAKVPPQHFFCVSTDKAANPVNIMGASKKLMEELILAYAAQLPVKTARFANVAFSNGSLPLGFLERLAKGQPWACPVGVRRFFVSPQESGELCLLAAIMGESGDIIFPKLDPVRDMIGFEQVAHDLLAALGMRAGEVTTPVTMQAVTANGVLARQLPEEWPVEFFASETSGEKAFEEFYVAGEELDLERFVNLGVVKNAPRRSLEEVDEIFGRLRELFARESVSKGAVVAALRGYLPNFEHIETGKGLDERR